jgi:ribosome biogenesis GTPase
VLRVAGPLAEVADASGTREVRLSPRLPGGPPVAGDRVSIDDGGTQGIIRGIAPRRTVLERIGSGGRVRAVVANADLLVVVAAVAEPPLVPRLIDRYAVAAVAGGLDMAVVLTKDDLPHDATEVATVVRRQRAAGHPVLVGSAFDAGLVEAVRDLIDGRLAAFAGHSGVGKSTLTTALTGVARATAEVSDRLRSGRHTTTDPRLIPLPGGGAVVDTAGIRSFWLPPMAPADIAAGFPDIVAAAGDCRFRDCRHMGDAGCAAPAAVEPERLESYRALIEAAESAVAFARGHD